MLLWQPQSSLRIRSVVIASLIVHALACFSLLFVYKDYHQRLFVDLSTRVPSQAIVKLLPLSASRSGTQKSGVKGGVKRRVQKTAKQSSSAKVTADKQKKKKAPTSLAKQSVIKKGTKGAVKKTKNVVQAKKQKLVEKKELPKKIDEKLAQEQKPKEIVQPPKEELKPVEPIKEESKAAPVKETVSEIAKTEAGAAVGPEGQEILYLTKQEFDALQIQQKLQECLFDLWTPPAGIPVGVLCEVLITVGWDGAILETEFLKKTNILMYDLSVQETLEQVTFPHEVWGKQITIAFKP